MNSFIFAFPVLRRHRSPNPRRLLRALFTLALLAASFSANACTCWHPKPDEYLSAGSLVFRGTVLSVKPASAQAPMGPGAGSVTLRGRQSGMVARFKLTTSIKGPAVDEIDVAYTQSDGANCGWDFKPGEQTVVLATGSRAGGYTTSMCMMIPYSSYTGRGDNQYANALEQYRATRESLARRRKAGANPLVLREQADFFMKYRDLEDAEEALTELLRVQPQVARTHSDRGDARYKQERFEHALADYAAAIAVDPKHPAARLGRTLALVKLGRLGELGPDERNFAGFDSGYNQKLSFARLDLRGASFRGAKLNSVDFSGSDLREADFSGANLHNCNFSGAQLDGARFEDMNSHYGSNFESARLAGASFKGTYLRLSRLNGAVLDNADFSKARLEQSSLEKASIKGANFKGASLLLVKLGGTRWEGQDLSGVDLRGADLRDAVFRNTSMREALFGPAIGMQDIMDLRSADLSGADLAGAKWGPALFDCRTRFPTGFSLADLPLLPAWQGCPGNAPTTGSPPPYEFQRGPRLTKLSMPKARFSGQTMVGFGLWNMELDGADFSGANLALIDIQSGSYKGANFKDANLQKALVSRAVITGASFENVNFSGARLFDLDFRKSRLAGAVLTGACFNDRTFWPDNFDPVAAGAQKLPCR